MINWKDFAIEKPVTGRKLAVKFVFDDTRPPRYTYAKFHRPYDVDKQFNPDHWTFEELDGFGKKTVEKDLKCLWFDIKEADGATMP